MKNKKHPLDKPPTAQEVNKRYFDFVEDLRSPAFLCESCEQYVPKNNPVHTCYDAKVAREKVVKKFCDQIDSVVLPALEKGKKYDSEKIPLELLSTEALQRIAEVLGAGAKKYGRNNWRQGLSFSRVYSALLRHLFSWQSGEDQDNETGYNHLAHAGCCIMFLLEYLKTHPELDDRFKLKEKK